MKKSRFTNSQIIDALKRVEGGLAAVSITRSQRNTGESVTRQRYLRQSSYLINKLIPMQPTNGYTYRIMSLTLKPIPPIIIKQFSN